MSAGSGGPSQGADSYSAHSQLSTRMRGVWCEILLVFELERYVLPWYVHVAEGIYHPPIPFRHPHTSKRPAEKVKQTPGYTGNTYILHVHVSNLATRFYLLLMYYHTSQCAWLHA